MSSSAEPRGLYEDSDTESLSNELSPTDGYFNSRRNYPTNILVPDPSLETDKAAEVREENEATRRSEASSAHRRQSQRTAWSSYSRPNVSPTQEEGEPHTEHSPLIPQSAPPAYSAATAGRSYQSIVPTNNSNHVGQAGLYNTIGGQGISSSSTEPEDMGGQPDSAHAQQRRVDKWKKRSRQCIHKSLKLMCMCFLVLVLLLIGVGFVTEAFTSVHHKGVGKSHILL